MSGIRIARRDELGGIVALRKNTMNRTGTILGRKNARKAMRRLLEDSALGRVCKVF